ncbi:MAG: SDR family NAD(P)-dependent oxidoreductase, partial [Pirellulales bacterium]|nr:SDR family NAD(P)-dependent oxidoreductase [Pirellulales bacterium]
MPKYLVTGGAGFIGSHIATALVERGDSVRILDNLSTGHRSNLDHLGDRIDFLEGDITCREDVDRAIRGVQVIFHQAALASVPRSIETPLDTHAACVTGTVHLLDAARQNQVRRVVFAGSSSVYGDQPYGSKRECDLPSPLSPYAAAKLAGEYYLQAFTA